MARAVIWWDWMQFQSDLLKDNQNQPRNGSRGPPTSDLSLLHHLSLESWVASRADEDGRVKSGYGFTWGEFAKRGPDVEVVMDIRGRADG